MREVLEVIEITPEASVTPTFEPIQGMTAEETAEWTARSCRSRVFMASVEDLRTSVHRPHTSRRDSRTSLASSPAIPVQPND